MENLYLIKIYNENECFYKIGLTVHKYCRFYEIMKTYSNVKILFMAFKLDAFKAMKAEKYLQSLFEEYTPLFKFGGYTECFSEIDINYFKNEFDIIFNKYEYIENLEITWR